MWLSKLLTYLRNSVRTLSKVTNIVAGVVLVAMMFLTAADVLLRYVFRKPISGSLELTEYMMVIVTGFGIAWCALQKGHVRVELVTSRFSPRIQSILSCITSFLAFALFILISWQTFEYIFFKYDSRITSSVLLIPLFPFIGLLFIGCAILCLAFLVEFFDSLEEVLRK